MSISHLDPASGQPKSREAILEELHYFVTQVWARQNREPVPDRVIVGFLAQRVPSNQVFNLIGEAMTRGIIVGGFTPRPKHEHKD